MTLASTSRPSIAGLPTLISSPSLNSSTRPSFTDDPGSAASRSTRMRSPGATRYCLPPLTTTADAELSGLGTAKDCTKPFSSPFRGRCPAGPYAGQGSAQKGRGDHDDQEHQSREGGDHPRVQAARDGAASPAQEHGEPDDHDRYRKREAEEPQQAGRIVDRRRDEQSREEPAVRKPGQDPAGVEPLPDALVGRRRERPQAEQGG